MTSLKRTHGNHCLRRLANTCLVLLCGAEMAVAHGWSLTVNAGSPRLFLYAGNGALSGSAGRLNGSVGRSGPVNVVEISVPVAQLGNGTSLPMTSNSTQSTSLYGPPARS